MRAFKITSSVFALFNLSMLRDINDQCREYTLLSWPLPGRLQKIWMRCKLACHLHRGRILCYDFEWHLPGALCITKSATHLLHILNCSACSNLSWKKSWSMTVKGINIWIRTYFVASNQNPVFQNDFTPHLAPGLPFPSCFCHSPSSLPCSFSQTLAPPPSLTLVKMYCMLHEPVKIVLPYIK